MSAKQEVAETIISIIVSVATSVTVTLLYYKFFAWLFTFCQIINAIKGK